MSSSRHLIGKASSVISPVAPSRLGKQQSTVGVPSRLQQASRASDESDEDSEDEDDDDDSDDNDNKFQDSKAAAKLASAKDLEWTQEEQQNVMKFYGMETLFPAVWGDDNIGGLEQTQQKTNEEADAANKLAVHEEDTSDPLKIKGKIKRPKWMKAKTDNSIFISDKNFSPKTFLKEVHKNTDFKELEQGFTRLKQSIAERNETTKGLVKKHFAKFVSAKTTIDSFYKEMRAKNLVSREDYGVYPFLRELSVLEKEANALYGPVLERRTKAAKIRVTLSILEQWKFFFNLGSSLKEMVKKGKYDSAVRDYKKGKNIMQSSFKENRKDKGRHTSFEESNLLPKNYQSVFEKLWEEVERVVADFREELFKSLRVASNPIETQEKIIGYLNELDSRRDPVWCYLDTQYTWVLENAMIIYNRHIRGMRDILKKLRNADGAVMTESGELAQLNQSIDSLDNLLSREYLNMLDEKDKRDKLERNLLDDHVHETTAWNLNDIKKALLCVTSDSFETQFGKEILVCFWKETSIFISELANVLTTYLPGIFRTCKMYLEERYLKKAEGKKGLVAERMRYSQSMINNVFDLIRIMIDYTFFIGQDENDDDDDEIIEEETEEMDASMEEIENVVELKKLMDYKSETNLDTISQADSAWKTFQKLSGGLIKLPAPIFSKMMVAHPLILIHYSTQIMDILHDCLAKIKVSCPQVEGFTLIETLEITVDTVKACLVKNICNQWVDVSKGLHNFEFWEFENHVQSEINPEKVKQDSTHLMKLNNKIFKLILRSLAIVLFGSHPEENKEPDFTANQTHIDRIRAALLESSFGILDGFHWHVAYWRDHESGVNFGNVEGWVVDLPNPKLHTILPDQKYKFGQFIPPDCAHFVETIKPKNFRDLDARSFMTLSNIDYLIKVLLPESRAIAKDKLNIDIFLDEQHISEISTMLSRIIIMNYAKRQHVILGGLVRHLVFYSGLDWASLQSPIAIRPQCLQLLQHLICVHASISDVSKSMLSRVFSEILLFLVQELLMSFRQVDRFNIPGMLQATLETEFLDTTLKAFETPESQAMFVQLYDLFERSTDPDENIYPEVMNDHLTLVKTFLEEAKSSTATQYRCFMFVEEETTKRNIKF